MRGVYSVRVKNSRNSYSFELKRNITILCGESGRGKTTLFEMIQEYNRFGKQSGVSVSCDRPLIALEGEDWEDSIDRISSSVIVIDEDSRFIRSRDFAAKVRGSDNYFLLVSRNYLPELPYSVDEIYEITGAKNKKFKRVYTDIDRMFDHPRKQYLPFAPEIIITEDAGSGYSFFKNAADDAGIECISANGKTGIFSLLKQYTDKNVVVIADGAAFGSEIREIAEQQKLTPRKLAIFLPESFEWLILKSGIIENIPDEMITHPEEYADSTKYMSWEQFFTDVLVQATKDSRFRKYSKKRLADFYLEERNAAAVKKNIQGIKL